MAAWILLTALVVPLLGVVVLRLLPTGSAHLARWIALATSLVALACAWFVVSLCVAGYGGVATARSFEPGAFPATQLNWQWAAAELDTVGGTAKAPTTIDVRLSLGLDGLSLWMFALSALLTVSAILCSWDSVRERPAAFFTLILILESGMLGVFAARDLILFYIFFEATLIPLFFLLGAWGGPDRRAAAIKFFVYSLGGSLMTFLGLLSIVLHNYQHTGLLSCSIASLAKGLAAHPIPVEQQFWVFLALFCGFAVKVPLFPFHTWLPFFHAESPNSGTLEMTGLAIKLGVYGFARFSLPLLPDASVQAMPWILLLGVISVVYGALVALTQRDLKRLIGYSSVSHLGFCTMGLFAFNTPGLQGSILLLVAHGISTSGLFALAGMLSARYGTREIDRFGGLAAKLPILATFMMLMAMASIALPGLSGFPGEFLLLLGVFQRVFYETYWEFGLILLVVSMSGIVLGAWYTLGAMRQIFFGPLREPTVDPKLTTMPVHDLSVREIVALTPLAVLVFWVGLQPQFFIEPMAPTLNAIVARAQTGYPLPTKPDGFVGPEQTERAFRDRLPEAP